ncbi:Zinc finger BED domain-containing protein RICESLEEPER 2 [Linum perenne]
MGGGPNFYPNANHVPQNQPQPPLAEHQPQPPLAENQPQQANLAENQPQPPLGENQPQQANLVNGIGNGDDNVDQSRLTSDVWVHFSRIRVNGVTKARCKYCRKLLSGDSNSGTSHLRNHHKICLQKKIHDGQQRVLGANYLPKGKAQMIATEYNYEVSKKLLCSMILLHEYPLSIVDHIGFKRYSCSLQPLFKVPCRNTIKKEILTLYEVTKIKIKRDIHENRGRITVTTNMWTATNQKRGYIAITAHYVDNSWNLRSIMLRFLYVPAPHTIERLAACLSSCLLSWNVDTKLSAITLDNYTTNDSMISLVRDKLMPPNLLMNVVRDGLDVIKDCIEKIRDSIGYWIATPKRVKFFVESSRHVDVTVGKKLVLDCLTRWNSTYKMLVVAIPYKDVFFCVRQRDPQYNSLPSNAQWDFAAVVGKLENFAQMTELFSGSNYPTANLFFPKVCDLRLAIMEWCADSNPIISQMAEKMWLKFTKYWDDIHLVLAVAVVLDPRYKLHLVEYYAAKLGVTNNDLVGDSVKKIIYDLVLAYQSKSSAAEGSSSFAASASAIDLDFELFMSQHKRSRTSSVATELDHYLAEEIIPRAPDFDILLWWKLNGAKYLTLQRIARDFLAIPITSVASESALSSCGRLLDSHRSKLHYKTVEAMLCA